MTKPNRIDVRRERQCLAHDKAARWLAKHSDNAPVIEPKAERKRKRKEAYEQDRIRRRDAAVRRGRAGASKTSTPPAASTSTSALSNRPPKMGPTEQDFP